LISQLASSKYSSPNSSHALKPPIVPVVLSQHEQELANLRGGKPGNTVTTTTTALPLLGDIPATPIAKLPATNHCGRFQFACHSGECIAVYNACDGIPQCEDGSDEGPECPASNKVEPAKVDVVQTNPSRLVPPISNGPFTKVKVYSVNCESENLSKFPFQQSPPSYQSTDMMQQQQQQQQPLMMSGQTLPITAHNREDPMTAPKQWPHQASNMGECVCTTFSVFSFVRFGFQ
jgi:Low-density lipoprotein receptor domain class A